MSAPAQPDPLSPPDLLTCTATSKRSGNRCKDKPVQGGNVCWKHGGAAPQVQAAARLRLMMAVDTSASRLLKLTEPKKGIPPNVQLAAINSHLDRVGLKAEDKAALGILINGNVDKIEIRLVPANQQQPQVIDVEPVNGKVNGHGGHSG